MSFFLPDCFISLVNASGFRHPSIDEKVSTEAERNENNRAQVKPLVGTKTASP